MKSSVRSLFLVIFAGIMTFFGLFHWRIQVIEPLNQTRWDFGLALPAYGGEILPFLCELVFLLAPVFALLYALGGSAAEKGGVTPVFPTLLPGLYAVLQFLRYAFEGLLSSLTFSLTVWIFLVLIAATGVWAWRRRRRRFALVPLAFFLTELILFVLSLLLHENLSPFARIEGGRIMGAWGYSYRLDLDRLFYFCSYGLYGFFLFYPKRR